MARKVWRKLKNIDAGSSRPPIVCADVKIEVMNLSQYSSYGLPPVVKYRWDFIGCAHTRQEMATMLKHFIKMKKSGTIVGWRWHRVQKVAPGEDWLLREYPYRKVPTKGRYILMDGKWWDVG